MLRRPVLICLLVATLVFPCAACGDGAHDADDTGWEVDESMHDGSREEPPEWAEHSALIIESDDGAHAIFQEELDVEYTDGRCTIETVDQANFARISGVDTSDAPRSRAGQGRSGVYALDGEFISAPDAQSRDYRAERAWLDVCETARLVGVCVLPGPGQRCAPDLARGEHPAPAFSAEYFSRTHDTSSRQFTQLWARTRTSDDVIVRLEATVFPGDGDEVTSIEGSSRVRLVKVCEADGRSERIEYRRHELRGWVKMTDEGTRVESIGITSGRGTSEGPDDLCDEAPVTLWGEFGSIMAEDIQESP